MGSIIYIGSKKYRTAALEEGLYSDLRGGQDLKLGIPVISR